MRFLCALVLLGMLGTAPAAASCRDSAGNLLAENNCGFDNDANGWTAAPGVSLSQDPADHGVLKAVADSQGSLTVLGPCVTAHAKTRYTIGARLRITAGAAYFCSVNIFQYSDDRCTQGEEPLGSAAGPPGESWAPLEGSATTSDTAKSVQVRPVCSGQPSVAIQFDDFVLSKN